MAGVGASEYDRLEYLSEGSAAFGVAVALTTDFILLRLKLVGDYS